MTQRYGELKKQLREYGLAPRDWKWKKISPRQRTAYLENKNEKNVVLFGSWSHPAPSQSRWDFLEWRV